MSTLRSLYRRTRSAYQRVFKREEDARTREIADVLENVVIFRELSRTVLRELAEMMHWREYRRDEFLYYENDPGMGLYIIRRGSVRLLVEDEEGAVHELEQEGESSIIGLLSLLDSLPRMETAQAMIDTQVLGFFRPDLNALLKRDPRLASQVVTAFARHLAQRQAALVRTLSSHEGRVAARKKLLTAEANPTVV